jgi:hypothetical protein
MFVVVRVPWHDEDRRCAHRARSVFVAVSRVWTVLVCQFPFEEMFLVGELVFRPDSGRPIEGLTTDERPRDRPHREHPRNGKSL